jgi:hypothetical protein
MLASAQAAFARPVVVVRASSIGARLDTDLLKGGGADDTVVLQHALDRAADGTAVHLIIDGPALVAGLDVYGSTTIECTAGAGLYLKDNSSRAIIRNFHRSPGAIVDEHIGIRGCFLNGNRKHQPMATGLPRPDVPNWSPSWSTGRQKDGTFISGLQFLGVNYLQIHDVTLWNIRAFGALIGNANFADIRNIIVDDGGGPNGDVVEYSQTDGLHFKGPLRHVTIDSVKLRVGDDGIAFDADDWYDIQKIYGPYVSKGPITDVAVSNIVFLPGQLEGITILSATERVDRIVISNVVGQTRMDAFHVHHWANPKGIGNIGGITVENFNVDRVSMKGNRTALIVIDAKADTLKLHDLSTRMPDDLPVVQIGPSADVGVIDLGLSVFDPGLAGRVVELQKGGHVNLLKLRLDWQGRVLDEGKNPIQRDGGAVDRIVWIDTPPRFVEAHIVREDRFSIDVEFSETLRRRLSDAGVEIKINGHAVATRQAVLQPNGVTVRYVLTEGVRSKDLVTWSYDGSEGDVQNLDGAYLSSVSEKTVRLN